MSWYRVEFYVRHMWDVDPPDRDAAAFMEWLREGQYHVDNLRVRPARDDADVHYGTFIASDRPELTGGSA